MRTFPSLAFCLSFLASCACSTTAAELTAENLILHVGEGSPSGSVVGNLAEVLEFGEQTTCRLHSQSDVPFEVNSSGELLVTASAPLDYETNRFHELSLEVKTPATTDPLQERFVELIGKSPASTRFLDRVRWDRRLVRVRVVIDDQPEPPQILQQLFPTVQANALIPGLTLGRVIAVDPDEGDQLQFRLLEAESLMSIDPISGQLSFQTGASVPDVATLRATVEVVDSQGLASSREIVIPIQGYPERAFEEPTVTAAQPEGSNPSSGDPPTEQQPSVATAGSVPAPFSREGGQESEVSVATTTAVSDETESQDSAVTQQQQPAVIAPPVSAGVDQTPAQPAQAATEQSRAAWLVVCCVSVLVFGVMCWGPLQRQFQKLVLRPETADAEPDNEQIDNRQTSPPEEIPPLPTDSNDREIVRKFRGKTDTRELHTLLESLDETYRSSSDRKSPAGNETDDAEKFLIHEDESGGVSSATATAMAVKLARESTSTSAVSGVTKPTPAKTVFDEKAERDQMEQFRQIARTFSRADIDRSRRAQMRGEWMSRGAAVTSCAMTGAICLFTGCFGPISVPCGTVLLAVAAALLMKQSLYFDSSKLNPAELFASETASSDQSPESSAES